MVDAPDLPLNGEHVYEEKHTSNSDSNMVNSQKRKGGWPKGKKRKQDSLKCKTPKAPKTGYVIFLNERRKEYKATNPELEFTTVTKLIGKEWTNLEATEKQKYLDSAKADKKRYREELENFRNENSLKTDSFVQVPCRENSHFPDSTTTNDEEELYCKVCDQYFVSLHNKSEHLYGKHHLNILASKASKCEIEVHMESDSRSEESSPWIESPKEQLSNECAASNVTQSILDLANSLYDREMEIKILNQRMKCNIKLKAHLVEEKEKYEKTEKSIRNQLDCLNANNLAIKDQIEVLRMVPSLFGVINYQF